MLPMYDPRKTYKSSWPFPVLGVGENFVGEAGGLFEEPPVPEVPLQQETETQEKQMPGGYCLLTYADSDTLTFIRGWDVVW